MKIRMTREWDISPKDYEYITERKMPDGVLTADEKKWLLSDFVAEGLDMVELIDFSTWEVIEETAVLGRH